MLSTEYIGTFEKLKFLCSCGNEFETDWHHFYTQHKNCCNDCSKEIRRQKKRVHNVEEVKALFEKHGAVYVSGDYTNTKSHFTAHLKCGHMASVSWSTLSAPGYTGVCVDCARKLGQDYYRFSFKEVKEKCDALGLTLLSTEYVNAREPLEFLCSCGRRYYTSWERVKCNRKMRCDYCTKRISSGEIAVENWLLENGVPYERQKTFSGLTGVNGRPYMFDFFLPTYNLCIEYDGQQHFRVTDFSGHKEQDAKDEEFIDLIFRDMEKDDYCRDNNIGLLRISYKDNIADVLSNRLIPRYAGGLKSS